MGYLKIKDNVDLEKLRDFGFKLAKEYVGSHDDFTKFLDGMEYAYDWYMIFEMNPDDLNAPYLTEDDLPTCYGWVRPDTRELWFDVVPNCTYHSSMTELEVMYKTIYKLTEAGLVEYKVI